MVGPYFPFLAALSGRRHRHFHEGLVSRQIMSYVFAQRSKVSFEGQQHFPNYVPDHRGDETVTHPYISDPATRSPLAAD